jgi:hypothetical protein
MTLPPFIELLPRDLELDGRTYAQLYRTHSRGGGRIVYLRNSLPGIARGHTIHVFQINVVDGKEQLGECLAVTPSADQAISIAGQTS